MSSLFVFLVFFDGSPDPLLEMAIIASLATFLVHLMTGIAAILLAYKLPNRFMPVGGVGAYVGAFTGLGILALFNPLVIVVVIFMWAFWSVGIVINVSLIVLALSVYIRERTNRVSAA